MNFVALLLTLFVGLFILIGSIVSIYYKNNSKITDFSIALAFGVIISLIIFELIPETFSILNDELGILRSIISITLLILIGIIALKILDLFIPHHGQETHHHHKNKNIECHNEHLYHIGIVSTIALVMHNLIEGMSLYLVASSNLLSGLLLCIGIGLHNIPMGLVIALTLSSHNHSNKKILNISLIVSFSTFIGGFIMFILGGVSSITEGILLGLTLGMLIYIAIFELLYQVYNMKDKRLSIFGTIFGIFIFVISLILSNI